MQNVSFNMRCVHPADELFRAWKFPNSSIQVDFLEKCLFLEDLIIELSLYSAAVSRFTINVS